MDKEVVPGPGVVESIEDFQGLKKPLGTTQEILPVKSERLQFTLPQPVVLAVNFGQNETAGPPPYSTADFSEIRTARRLKQIERVRYKTTSGN